MSELRKVGVIGLAGAPNVGKSTLVNRLVGQKVSIVSERPQTTRDRVCGIYTDSRMQLVLVDVPGILAPQDAFNEALMNVAAKALEGCDRLIHMRDARRLEDPADLPVREMILRTQKPVWLLWNKIDRTQGKMYPSRTDGLTYERVFGISAKTGRGLEHLLQTLEEVLPLSELLYDPDQLCDRDMRFLVAELVREKLFRCLGDELPYALDTRTETFDEGEVSENEAENSDFNTKKVFIRVEIITERESHRPIILGENGARIKRVGQDARLEIEKMLGRPVYLELWVKIRPKWRKQIHSGTYRS